MSSSSDSDDSTSSSSSSSSCESKDVTKSGVLSTKKSSSEQLKANKSLTSGDESSSDSSSSSSDSSSDEETPKSTAETPDSLGKTDQNANLCNDESPDDIDMEDSDVAAYVKRRTMANKADESRRKAISKVLEQKRTTRPPTVAILDPKKAVRNLVRTLKTAKSFEITKLIRRVKKISQSDSSNEKAITYATNEIELMKSIDIYDIVRDLLPKILGKTEDKPSNGKTTSKNSSKNNSNSVQKLLKRQAVVKTIYALSQKSKAPTDSFWRRRDLNAAPSSSNANNTVEEVEEGNDVTSKKPLSKQQKRSSEFKQKRKNKFGGNNQNDSVFISSLSKPSRNNSSKGAVFDGSFNAVRKQAARSSRDNLLHHSTKNGSVSNIDYQQGSGKNINNIKRKQSRHEQDIINPRDSKRLKHEKLGLEMEVKPIEEMHPSWAARRMAKSKQSIKISTNSNEKHSSKKIVFDDSD